ncbi:MAG TPA: hypothetical protein DCM05_13770 [Elusimicrobia bacterium]|nr:hypothetical protein [Elusimicrobiota bacterium]
MAESQEFKPLAMVGTLSTSDTSELRFYVDEYRGYPYASIRTFVSRENYSGPTKAGITMNPEVLTKVIETLEQLPPEPQASEDQELARIPRKTGLELVVRITLYRDSTGVDMREWVDDGTYKGWSKRGVRIPYGDLKKSLEYLAEMLALLREKSKSARAGTAPQAKPAASPEKKPRGRKASGEAPSEKAG